MRVPVSWLRDYVPIEMPLDELATRLSISTAEVEGIERRGVPDSDGNLGLFRVGKVVEAAKHPNADRLQLCRVDIGEAEPRQIVCGAWNFGAGATVAVALRVGTRRSRELDARHRRDLARDPVDRGQVGPVEAGLDLEHLLG
ncbi:MAG: phenylalanyl-tRNA synthetase beta chain, partial [Gaiellaceae bacterium]|nr:phenylalanyl-tRNA synthetase beta chain [Gaiellaceae bacterium]